MVLSAGVLKAKCMPSYENRAYYDPKLSVSAYGGYNITGNAPVYGGVCAIEVLCFRADFDLGGTTINHQLCNKHFFTLSPSIGLVVGEKHKVYVMYGLQTYAYIATMVVTECEEDRLFTDMAYNKLKLGYQCTVWKQMFISLELSHLFQPHQHGYLYFPSNDVRLGIGWKF